MEWYNILALSLSALALMGSCFTYFVHDKKLKKQQTLLNDLQIKKLQREIKDDELVEIRPTLVNVNKSMHTSQVTGALLIKNYGRSEATDVEIRAFIKDGMYSHYNEKQRAIKSFLPGQYDEIPVDWGFGANTIEVWIGWNDISGKGYFKTYSLPLY